MAKKYSKYLVTRNDQNIFDDLKLFVQNFPSEKNILNYGNMNSWHLYEMIQKMFFCNWPNTNFRKYFVKATPVVLYNGNEILGSSSNDNPDNYFGYFFINSDSKTEINFNIDDKSDSILAESRMLLISPSNFEKHSIKWQEEYPLVLVKFNIIPVENLLGEYDWTPL